MIGRVRFQHPHDLPDARGRLTLVRSSAALAASASGGRGRRHRDGEATRAAPPDQPEVPRIDDPGGYAAFFRGPRPHVVGVRHAEVDRGASAVKLVAAVGPPAVRAEHDHHARFPADLGQRGGDRNRRHAERVGTGNVHCGPGRLQLELVHVRAAAVGDQQRRVAGPRVQRHHVQRVARPRNRPRPWTATRFRRAAARPVPRGRGAVLFFVVHVLLLVLLRQSDLREPVHAMRVRQHPVGARVADHHQWPRRGRRSFGGGRVVVVVAVVERVRVYGHDVLEAADARLPHSRQADHADRLPRRTENLCGKSERKCFQTDIPRIPRRLQK